MVFVRFRFCCCILGSMPTLTVCRKHVSREKGRMPRKREHGTRYTYRETALVHRLDRGYPEKGRTGFVVADFELQPRLKQQFP